MQSRSCCILLHFAGALMVWGWILWLCGLVSDVLGKAELVQVLLELVGQQSCIRALHVFLQLMEEEIMDALEGLCDPDGDTGSWIAKTDLQESGTELKLVDMGEVCESG